MAAALKKGHTDNVYTLEGSSAWVCAGVTDIWIVKGPHGVSVSIWDSEKDELIDAVFKEEKRK
jgi:hypothetical protein